MRLCLEKPPIIGEINADLFLPLVEVGLSERGYGQPDNFPADAASTLQIIAELDHPLGAQAFSQAIVRTRQVKPGKIPKPKSQGKWHTDSYDLLTSNVNPTEFIHGSLQSVREILQLTKRDYAPRLRDSRFVYYLAQELQGHEDKVLKDKFGFQIWSAEPYAVVRSTGVNIHRTPRNLTNAAIMRTVAILAQ